MEDIPKAIRCADKDKVVYALSKLRSEALSAWWDIVKVTSEPSAWSQFKDMFKDNYYPIIKDGDAVRRRVVDIQTRISN
ncbi:hypothetical protein Tco_1357714 [Tanacetum coccineum]